MKAMDVQRYDGQAIWPSGDRFDPMSVQDGSVSGAATAGQVWCRSVHRGGDTQLSKDTAMPLNETAPLRFDSDAMRHSGPGKSPNAENTDCDIPVDRLSA